MVEGKLMIDSDRLDTLIDIDMKDFIVNGVHNSIKNPNTVHNDINYISIFDAIVKKVNNEEDDDDLINQLKNEKETLYCDVKNMLEDNLNMTINLETCLPGEQYDIVHILYSYFVNEYHSNIVEFLTNYIVKNKKSIFMNMTENRTKKEVTDALAKKVYRNSKDAVIMSNVYSIMKTIMGGDIDQDEFFKHLLKNISPTNKVVSDLLLKHIAKPIAFDADFYSNYMSFALSNESIIIDLMVELQIKLNEIFQTNDSSPILFD